MEAAKKKRDDKTFYNETMAKLNKLNAEMDAIVNTLKLAAGQAVVPVRN